MTGPGAWAAAPAESASAAATTNHGDGVGDRSTSPALAELATRPPATHEDEASDQRVGYQEDGASGAEDVDTRASPDQPGPDTFTGRTVFVFTNQVKGDARSYMAAAFRELGAASVELYHLARTAGPAQYPSEALVVLDFSFASHADTIIVRERAAAAGCWYYEGRHGTRSLARAAARAYLAWSAASRPSSD